ncbi:MAG: hypothetical protein AAFY33_20940 [Cyanobacteria bacterium J06643_4]
MTTADLKTQITKKLDQLSPRLLSVVNDLVNALTTEAERASQMPDSSTEQESPNAASPNAAKIDDSLVGMIKGPPDLAANAEHILREDIKPKSGWSCKP